MEFHFKHITNILQVFEPRLKLSKEEVNFLDNLEKLFSPASVMSHDGEVFLNNTIMKNLILLLFIYFSKYFKDSFS